MAGSLALLGSALMRRGSSLVAGPCCCDCCPWAEFSLVLDTTPGRRTNAGPQCSRIEIELSDGRSFTVDSGDAPVSTGTDTDTHRTKLLNEALGAARCGASYLSCTYRRFQASTDEPPDTDAGLYFSIRGAVSFTVRASVEYGGVKRNSGDEAGSARIICDFVSWDGRGIYATTMPADSTTADHGTTIRSFARTYSGRGSRSFTWYFTVSCP